MLVWRIYKDTKLLKIIISHIISSDRHYKLVQNWICQPNKFPLYTSIVTLDSISFYKIKLRDFEQPMIIGNTYVTLYSLTRARSPGWELSSEVVGMKLMEENKLV